MTPQPVARTALTTLVFPPILAVDPAASHCPPVSRYKLDSASQRSLLRQVEIAPPVLGLVGELLFPHQPRASNDYSAAGTQVSTVTCWAVQSRRSTGSLSSHLATAMPAFDRLCAASENTKNLTPAWPSTNIAP